MKNFNRKNGKSSKILTGLILFLLMTILQAQSLNYVVDQHYDIAIASFNSSVLDVSAQEATPFTMLFNGDGSVLYVGGWNGKDINQYNLTTAFDVSTATFKRVAFKESGMNSDLYSMLFNDDGTMFYVLESSGLIWQYNLTTAYDIATAAAPEFYPWALQVATSANPIDMIYNDDGTILYVLDVVAKNIRQYDLSKPYDIRSATEVGPILTLDSSTVFAISMVFNHDGTKLFIANSGANNIHQYDLTTAYDISTASFSQVALDVAAQGTNLTALLFNDNGSKLYVVGTGNISVNQYDINKTTYPETQSNNGAIDNASPLIINLTDDTFTTSSGILPSNQYTVGNLPVGLTSVLSIDGTSTQATLTLTGNAATHADINDVSDLTFAFSDAAFTSGDAANVVNSGFNSAYSSQVPVDFLDNFRLDYTFLDGGDVSTAEFNNAVLDVGADDNAPFSMIFNNDGSKFYVIGAQSQNILQYNLGVAYDVSSASYAGVVLNVSAQNSLPVAMIFNDDGSKLYIMGDENNEINQYSLASAYDISTASFEGVALSIASNSARSMLFNDDGSKLYVLYINSVLLVQYNLSDAYDISTGVYDNSVIRLFNINNVGNEGVTSPRSMIYSQDGKKLYVMGSENNDIHQWDLAAPYNLSNAQLNSLVFSIPTQNHIPLSMIYNDEFNKLYILGSNDVIDQYDLDISNYRESATGDGTLENINPLTITLQNDTFTTSSVAMPTNHYTVNNLPVGLNAVLTVDISATVVTLSLSGAALNNLDADDLIANISISFQDAAFTSNNASNIINSGSISPVNVDLDIDYIDVIYLYYASGSHTETASNIGEVDNINPLTLILDDDISQKTFTTISGVLPSNLYSLGNVPAGLTPVLTIDGTGTQATLTFTGMANLHQVSNDVSTLTIQFTDAAFTNGGAEQIFNSGRPSPFSIDVGFSFTSNPNLEYVTTDYYDVSKARYKQAVTLNITSSRIRSIRSVLFNQDGTEMNVLANQMTGSAVRIFRYTLSTPYDVTTASFETVVLTATSYDQTPQSITFNGDGSSLFLIGSDQDFLYEFHLSTPYDINTRTGSTNVGQLQNFIREILFNNDGTHFYAMGWNIGILQPGNDIDYLLLNQPYEISSFILGGVALDLDPFGLFPDAMMYSEDGLKLYVSGGSSQIIEFGLNPAYDITTASHNRTINVSQEDHSRAISTMLFNGDGSQLYLTDDAIKVYDLSFRQFPESLNNDGTIGNSANDNYHPLVINLTGDTFTTTSGVLPTNQYNIGNLPAGLEAILTIDSSGTIATMTFAGQATFHQNSNDVSDLTFNFADSAFSNTDAIRVVNAGGGTPYSSNIGINFEDNSGFPVAVDDNYQVNVNGSLTLSPLDGDSDPDGDNLYVASFNGVALAGFSQTIAVNNGVINIVFGNAFTFVPDTDFIGTVSFTYAIHDNNGGTAQANQTIVVNTIASIGGTISGLNGTVQLQNNGADNLQISSNGSYQFSNSLNSGDGYLVSVTVQPTSPNQTCDVINNSGSILDANISNIDISCTTNQYFIGGSINGLLEGNFMTLQNNLNNDLLIFNNTFVFSQPLDDMSSYSVSIKYPSFNPIQPCVVVNGSSTLAGIDVTDVEINCEIGVDLIYRDGFEFQQPVN